MKILSDEGISEVIAEAFKDGRKIELGPFIRTILEAQHHYTLQQVVEWGEGGCPHVHEVRHFIASDPKRPNHRRYCAFCWQSLKEMCND